MNKIKLYIILIITTLFIGFCTTIGIQNHKLNKAKSELELSEINYKALENECNKLTSDNIEYFINNNSTSNIIQSRVII